MTMPAARVLDQVITGHPCSAITTIISTLQDKVFIEGSLGAVVGSPLDPTHTILTGGSCVPHPGMVVNTGSTKVFFGGIPAARVGDSADISGAVSSGSAKVFIGG